MTILISSLFALCLGLIVPKRWGVWGFVAASAVLFLALAGYNTASGFEGTSLEDSLLLFNGSVLSYLGFNLQITLRALAAPVFVLAAVLIYRLSLRRD